MKTPRLILTTILVTVFGISANAQNCGCTDEERESILEDVSVYQSSMKYFKESKDARYLEEAYPHWKVVVEKCPKQSKNLYINGDKIINGLLAKTTDEAKREEYINALMTMHDKRIEAYPNDKAEILAKKAKDIDVLKKEAGLKESFETYTEAVNLGGDKLDAFYIYQYFMVTVKYVRAGFAEPTLVVDNYDIASDLLEKEVQECYKDTVNPDTVRANQIRESIGNVEAVFSPYATCDQLVEIYKQKFEATPDNVDLLKKITNIMMKKGCTEDPLFFDATEKLYTLEPSPVTAMRMGQMSISKKKYSDAVKYLNDAVKGLTEKKDIYKAYILLGHANSGMGSMGAARSAFNDAARTDPSKGEPYLCIAQLYMKFHSVASGDGIGGRSAYWAAADMAAKAKNVDSTPDVVAAANKIIGSCAAGYPKKADAFMVDLIDGHSFTVPGIGVVTTVRTR